MKILIFCALLSATTLFHHARAQTINDVPLSDINVEYVEIVGTGRILSSRVVVDLDFGQRQGWIPSTKKMRIKDRDGRNLKFNSMIDALNFMRENGYEYADSYAISYGRQFVYHYLLRKSDY